MAPPRVPMYERWLTKVDDKSTPEGCWPWMGQRSAGRYGVLCLPGRRRRGIPSYVMAHRFSYEHHVGPIPDGLFVCHTCDNPPCVRPDHLWVGTAGDNNRDSFYKGRRTVPVLREDEHPNRTISGLDAQKIRRLYAQGGIRQVDLAVEFGIGQTAISKIVRGHTWKSYAA